MAFIGGTLTTSRRTGRGAGHDLIVSRLWNWARWAREDADTPHVAITSIYAEWNPYGKGRDQGWGEAEAPPPTEEYDEDDAEVMDGWIRQVANGHRVVIVRRFSLRHRVGHLEVDAAVRALADLMDANWATVDKMEGRDG
jgi:hypothetical protein